MISNEKINLPNVLRGRNINTNVIPTVCSIKLMLNHLRDYEWDKNKLKPWEIRSYKAYNIDRIIHILKETTDKLWPEIIKFFNSWINS